MVHEVTIKQSLKRYGMWQIKGKHHELYPLTDMRLVVLKMVTHLGFGTTDNVTRFLLRYSEMPFEGYLIELEKIRISRDSYGPGCEYNVVGTQDIEFFMSDPIFPSALLKQIGEWPDKLYIGLTVTTRTIFLD